MLRQPSAARRDPPAAWRDPPAAWRRAAGPLGCAVVLAVGGVLLLAASGATGDPVAHVEHGAAATAAPFPGIALRLRSTPPQPAAPSGPPIVVPPGGPGPLPIPTGSAGLADPLAGPVPDAYLQQLLDATPTYTPPVLPAATRKAAIRAAGRVLVADLTGTGRDRFPGFWSEPTHTAWTGIRVQATTAQTAGLTPARVAVTLIWAGTSPTGEQVERRRTVITMELTGPGWWPVSVG